MSRLTSAIVTVAFPAVIAVIIFAAAGRCNLPFVWAVIGAMMAFYAGLAFFADPTLMRERISPGPGSRDHLTRVVGGLALLAHWVLVGLDAGRFRWSPIPFPIQLVGLAGFLVSFCFLFWVVVTNPFYSSVVRIQKDRGQYTVTAGPYRFIRHPGYAASLLSMVFGGAALGSWIAMLPMIVFFALFIRRTLLEDRILQAELDGYAEYAKKVRWRLVVGIF